MIALERAIDAVNAFVGEAHDESKALVAAKVRALLVGYDARWRNAGYVALEVERPIVADLWNPDTGRASRSFQTAGQLDVYVSLHRHNYLMDHKTTSVDISDPNAAYWQQLAVDAQSTHYQLLKWLHGEKPDGAIWDVTRKPQISPKRLSAAVIKSVAAERRYFGRNLDDATVFGLQTSDSETLEMYEARLAHDCTVERPEWYFQRRAVPRLDHEILEYAEDLWQIGQNILASRKQKRLPKNSGACLLYGSPCQFLGICSGHDSPESDRWRRREHRHPELTELEPQLDALTHSRIRTFQTCPVKHRFQYEMCLERYDEDERESLWFGSLFHEGLRAWWECFKIGDENGKCDNDQPATAVGPSCAAKTELAR